MIRVYQAYEVSDGIDSIALTAAESWTVVGTYEAGPTTAEYDAEGLTVRWDKHGELLAYRDDSPIVEISAADAADLRARLEADGQVAA